MTLLSGFGGLGRPYSRLKRQATTSPIGAPNGAEPEPIAMRAASISASSQQLRVAHRGGHEAPAHRAGHPARIHALAARDAFCDHFADVRPEDLFLRKGVDPDQQSSARRVRVWKDREARESLAV